MSGAPHKFTFSFVKPTSVAKQQIRASDCDDDDDKDDDPIAPFHSRSFMRWMRGPSFVKPTSAAQRQMCADDCDDDGDDLISPFAPLRFLRSKRGAVTTVGSSSAFRDLLSVHWPVAQLRQHRVLDLTAPGGKFEFQLEPCRVRLTETATVRGVVIGTSQGDEFIWFSAAHPMVVAGRASADSPHCAAVARMRSLAPPSCAELQNDKIELMCNGVVLGTTGLHAIISVACRLLGGLFYYRCASAWFIALEEVDETVEFEELPVEFRSLGSPVGTMLTVRLAAAEASTTAAMLALEVQKLAMALMTTDVPWARLIDVDSMMHATALHVGWHCESVSDLSDARLRPFQLAHLEGAVSATVVRALQPNASVVVVACDANGSVVAVDSHCCPQPSAAT